MPTPKKSKVRLTQEQLENLVAGRSDEQILRDIKRLLIGGRPPKTINLEEMAQLRAVGCSVAEIASYFDVSVNTIDRKLKNPDFKKFFDRGEHLGNMRLRRAQFQAAVNDKNPTMLIWMGKQRLGQKDSTEISDTTGGKVEIIKRVIGVSDDEL